MLPGVGKTRELTWGFLVGDGGWVEATWGLGSEPGWDFVMRTTESWVVYVRMEPMLSEDRLRIAALHVPRPTAKLLREIKLSTIEEILNLPDRKQTILEHLHKPAPKIEDAIQEAREEMFGLRIPLKRPQGRGLSDEFYADVARSYRGAISLGIPARQALAQDTGVSESTVARWVHQARRLGHLGPGKPGKATP